MPSPQDASDRQRPSIDPRAMTLAWGGAWLLAAALIAATQYASRDPDTQLYAGIAARLTDEPVSQWIAPEWWGLWGETGLFAEHPAGLFVLPATLARLGYPAPQAAYAVNAFYQVLAFLLVTLIAAAVVDAREARALGWLLQLLPIAFVFRIRVNHEYAVLAGTLLALYATERARARPLWALGMLAGFCYALVVKGVFAFIVPVICTLWLVARQEQGARARPSPYAWTAVAAMPIVGALVTWGYEAAYVQATGVSFLDMYTGSQIPRSELIQASLFARSPYTGGWYVTRVIWYAFPWSVVALGIAIRGIKSGQWRPWGRFRHETGTERNTRAGPGAWFALVAAAVLTGAFSLAHRKADRYIFPAYFLVGAVGAIGAMRRFPRLAELVEKWDRPWAPAAIYVGLFLLRLITWGRLPTFTFWRT
jgi:4-amino-4-deoxy-L-arabinose transferase-like glycosyltransferase